MGRKIILKIIDLAMGAVVWLVAKDISNTFLAGWIAAIAYYFLSGIVHKLISRWLTTAK
jgi:hypothetical protein